MKALGPPSLESAAEGERDFIKALEKEAKKHARKKARTIDPLAWSHMIGDTAISNYHPESLADEKPPTPGQLAFMERHQISHDGIQWRGLASKIIGRFLSRHEKGLATGFQLTLLKQLGLPEETTATLTQKEASEVIDATLKERKRIA